MTNMSIVSPVMSLSMSAKNANKAIFCGTPAAQATQDIYNKAVIGSKPLATYVPTLLDVVDFLRFRFGSDTIKRLEKEGLLTKESVMRLKECRPRA